jgi:hypothetical protein
MADTVVQCSANELLRVLPLEQRVFRVDPGSCHDHFLSHWWLSDRVHAGHPISERLPWQADNLFMLQLEWCKAHQSSMSNAMHYLATPSQCKFWGKVSTKNEIRKGWRSKSWVVFGFAGSECWILGREDVVPRPPEHVRCKNFGCNKQSTQRAQAWSAWSLVYEKYLLLGGSMAIQIACSCYLCAIFVLQESELGQL